MTPGLSRSTATPFIRCAGRFPLLGYVAVAYQNNRGVALMVAGFLLILVAISIMMRQRRIAKARPALEDGVS